MLNQRRSYLLLLVLLGCSGVPSALPTTEPTTTPQTQEALLPAPRFVVSRDGFGSVSLGSPQRELVKSLPLDLRLVLSEGLPAGLAGQVFTITNDADKPLFRLGLVDNQIAWLLAETAPSEVGTELGVGLGSSLSLSRKNLGAEKPLFLDDDPTPWVEFTDKFPGVRFSFGPNPTDSSSMEKILLIRESLLPKSALSLRGIVMPNSQLTFSEGGKTHEVEVSTAASLPVVGAMLEGEGTRQSTGAIKLTKQFAVNPCSKDVAAALQDKVRSDPDFLSYVSLLVVRHQVAEYRVEALPDNNGEHSALVIFSSPEGDGYSVLRLLADGSLTIIPAVFGVDRASYLENL